MKFLVYIIFRVTIFLFSITPFPVLFIISDCLGFILFYLVGYRKKVVFDNLKKCFPKKSDKEISKLSKDFFKHLGDITVESIKGYTLQKSEVLKRYKILNPEILNYYYDQNRTLICLASHFGNWEWGLLAVGLQMKYNMISLYKPLSNERIEKYLIDKRARYNMTLISIYETRQSFESVKSIPSAYIMAADQNPPNKDKAIWVNFMGIDTACLHGSEYYAKKYNMPVFFFDVRKPKRGYYTLEIKEISADPTKEKNDVITAKYMNKLENVIREEPAYWLWSHKRWKNFRTQKTEPAKG